MVKVQRSIKNRTCWNTEFMQDFGQFSNKLICCTVFLIEIQSISLTAIFKLYPVAVFCMSSHKYYKHTTKNILLLHFAGCCAAHNWQDPPEDRRVHIIENPEQQYTIKIECMIQRELMVPKEVGWDKDMSSRKCFWSSLRATWYLFHVVNIFL